ncbi:hypothetical protein D3C80_1789680 [compost metagenome]
MADCVVPLALPFSFASPPPVGPPVDRPNPLLLALYSALLSMASQPSVPVDSWFLMLSAVEAITPPLS